jgi:hypothetical protein
MSRGWNVSLRSRLRLRLSLCSLAVAAGAGAPASFAIEPVRLEAPPAAERFLATADRTPGPTLAAVARLNANATDAPPHALGFDKRPNWIRNLEQAARRGITVASVRDNEDTRLVFGMTRKGYVGFFTVPKQD